MKVGKPTSKRTSARLKYKIQKRSSSKQRKERKIAKKSTQWKSKHSKDPGIPNSFPFKDQLLHEAEERKRLRAEEISRLREQAKEARREAKKELKEAAEAAEKKARGKKAKTAEGDDDDDDDSTAPDLVDAGDDEGGNPNS